LMFWECRPQQLGRGDRPVAKPVCDAAKGLIP
jgi:hypothetical protein